MHEFTVTTGNLKITLVAESSRDAALEAVQIWEACSLAEMQAQRDAAHRANLAPLTSVKRNGTKQRYNERRFATFNLLATVHGESASTAWERVLQSQLGGLN